MMEIHDFKPAPPAFFSSACVAASFAKPSTMPEFVSTASGQRLLAARFSKAMSSSVILTFTWMVLFILLESRQIGCNATLLLVLWLPIARYSYRLARDGDREPPWNTMDLPAI